MKEEVGGLSRGVTSRLATAGASVVLSGALLFGAAGTAQAETVAAPAGPAVSTQVVVPAAAATTDPTYRRWCHRVWHKGGWTWFRGHKHWRPGYWTCEWRRR